jgi:hypothetical protein
MPMKERFSSTQEGRFLMTMWLTYPVMFKVRPVPKKQGWFEIASRPYRSDYSEVYEFAGDNRDDIVRGAQLFGWHDNDNLLEDDPRFNRAEDREWDRFFNSEDEHAEPTFVVVKKDDEYEAMFMCNAPEGLLFDYLFDEEDGPENPETHFPAYRADSQKRWAAHYKQRQANEAKERAARVTAAKKAADAATKKAAAKPKKKAKATA